LGFHSIAGIRSWPSPSSLSPAGRCPMTTAPSTALVMIQPAVTDAERLALAGYRDGTGSAVRTHACHRGLRGLMHLQVPQASQAHDADGGKDHAGQKEGELEASEE
jgi:hypothetical protein